MDTSYVAVGLVGLVGTSENGRTWQWKYLGPRNSFSHVFSYPGGLIAVGRRGTIALSDNGQDWQISSSGTTENLLAATYHSLKLYVGGLSMEVLP